MNVAIFEGSGVAVITPFDSTGKVDYEAFRRLLDLHLNHSTDAIIITGTTGESATLSDEEQLKLIEIGVNHVAGRVPVIAGTGSNATMHSIELSQAAEKLGADGLLCVTPYYNKASDKGMRLHFEAIANAVSIPIILYHVPGRTGATLSPEQVAMLSKHPNIVAIKDATGDIEYTKAVKALVDDSFTIYSGNDDGILDVLEVGGKGVISVLANVAPKETHDMCMAYLSGDVHGARQIEQHLAELIHDLFVEVNPIPVKYLQHLLGYNENVYRLPLCAPAEAIQAKLKTHLPMLAHYTIERAENK